MSSSVNSRALALVGIGVLASSPYVARLLRLAAEKEALDARRTHLRRLGIKTDEQGRVIDDVR